MDILTGNSMWHLITQSDATCKAVLLVLLGMSVLCWTIFFAKLILLHLKNKQCVQASNRLLHIKSMKQLSDFSMTIKNSVPGYFLLQNLAFTKEVTNDSFDKTVTDNNWMLIERHCDATVESMIVHSESYLPILSTCAAVATLLGLLGTVWGLIHAFMRISETHVADIATIAPGIAEALITTLAGLFVAIPAFVMFNYLQTKVRHFEHNLFILADRMNFIMQQLRQQTVQPHTFHSTSDFTPTPDFSRTSSDSYINKE